MSGFSRRGVADLGITPEYHECAKKPAAPISNTKAAISNFIKASI
jgi:hypothetical protein